MNHRPRWIRLALFGLLVPCGCADDTSAQAVTSASTTSIGASSGSETAGPSSGTGGDSSTSSATSTTGAGGGQGGQGGIGGGGAIDAAERGANKVFGYAFGDGNYVPHLAPPAFAFFGANELATARDFLKAACEAGYDGSITSTHEPPGQEQVPCAQAATKPLTKKNGTYGLRVEGFVWPSGGDFGAYVNGADPEVFKPFLAGVLPCEGSIKGLIDDQYLVPPGVYTEPLIDDKLSKVVVLLQRAGFTTATKTDGNWGPCTGNDCRQAVIDGATEGCRFNHVYGYDIAVYSRVPGAVCAGGTCTEPPACK